MSIVFIGSGAIGQFYAAQFIHAGHDVRLHARRDAALLARQGMRVTQVATKQIASTAQASQLFFAPDRFRVSSDPTALATPIPDWVFLSLKTTGLDDARALIAPLLGPRTRIVVMCNGLGVEDRLAAWFGAERIFGLLCFVCVNRDDDGTVRHLGHGMVAAGHLLDDAAERAALAELCRSVGIRCAEPASLLEARWRKMVWNVAYNGLAVANNCTTDVIIATPALRAEARALMLEVIAAGNADLAAHGRSERIPADWADAQENATLEMDAYAPSTLLDLRAGRALESDVLFAEPLRRARALGVPAPAMERLNAAVDRLGKSPRGDDDIRTATCDRR
jgi:2-dehydropantoate 2-reductase